MRSLVCRDRLSVLALAAFAIPVRTATQGCTRSQSIAVIVSIK
jgi:hypothetical protein